MQRLLNGSCHFISDRIRSSCTHCDKTYATKQGLQIHIQREHQKNKEPTESCDKCGLTFTYRRDLRIHVRWINMDSFLPHSQGIEYYMVPMGYFVKQCPFIIILRFICNKIMPLYTYDMYSRCDLCIHNCDICIHNSDISIHTCDTHVHTCDMYSHL